MPIRCVLEINRPQISVILRLLLSFIKTRYK